MKTEGNRKEKNWFRPEIMIVNRSPVEERDQSILQPCRRPWGGGSPTVQERMVEAAISGSSVLATADRTSGYGESSSRDDVSTVFLVW